MTTVEIAEDPHPSGRFSPQFHIYTGDGKGKTTAAIGLAIRALGAGLRVDFIQFDKGHAGEEHYNERKLLRALPGLRFEATGMERLRPDGSFRLDVSEEDRGEARRGLELARLSLSQGDADLLILDEIITAAACGLIPEQGVWDLVDIFKAARPRELVMTGRGASERLAQAADLVTEMKCVKHYYLAGIPARSGIDF